MASLHAFRAVAFACLGLLPFVRGAPAEPLQGTLPNGVRYFILQQPGATGRVSLRLVVHAGSLDEREDERGYAHFVEHMAFNGTTHYPPGKLVQFFQRHGLDFGSDLGATTSFTFTLYKIDLPRNSAADLGEAFRVLRDYADGIAFGPPEVQREKGVMLSELRARSTDAWRTSELRLAALHEGTELPRRFPLGEAKAIEGTSAAALRGFYQRCYRPERMTLLVVGDITHADAQKLIDETFASLPATGAGPAPIKPTQSPPQGLQAHVIASSTVSSAIASLSTAHLREPETDNTREAGLAAAIVMRVLNRRLIDRRLLEPERFGSAAASYDSGPDNAYVVPRLEAHARPSDWPAAVKLLETELRRAREEGFTPEELAEAKTSFLAVWRSSRDAMSGNTAPQLANEISASLIAQQPWRDDATFFAFAESYLSRITPEIAATSLRALFPEENLHLIVTLPQPFPESEAAVLAVYRESAALPLEKIAPHEAGELRFHYGDFGPPGRIEARVRDADLTLDRITFANQARLNLRRSTTEPSRFQLVARVGRGYADLPPDRPGLLGLASSLLGVSDFGRHTHQELGRLIRLRAVAAGVTFRNGELTVELEGPAAQLPFALQFLTAFLSDSVLDESRLPQALSLYSSVQASLLGTSESYSSVEAMFRLTGNDRRFQLPPADKVAQYPYPEIAAWVKSRWLDGPLEVGVIGDIDVESAIGAAAASIGTLSPRREPAIAESERLHFRTTPYRQVTPLPLADQAATVRLMWPAPDVAKARAFYALQFANNALIDRLHLKLREELGVTYSPRGGVNREPGQRNFAFASAVLTFAPDQARDLADRVIRIADEFAKRGLSREEFSRLKEPLRVQAKENIRQHAWWLQEVLTRAQSEPGVLEDARVLSTIFDELTREEVNRAAATHFRSANSQVVGVIPRATTPPTPTPPPVGAQP